MEQFKMVPFEGSVTVFFADSVIASTANAMVQSGYGGPDVFYIPIKDIYFEFLTPMNRKVDRPGWGVANSWRVSAAGEAAQDFMWTVVDPDVSVLTEHGTFNPEIARIEATSAGNRVQMPAMATDDSLVRHLVETSDLSPLQAQELVRRHGHDRAKLEEIARTFKAES
ncbi:DUF427 domain-containing protein [Aminobacter sp. UC22_36]|uniref:DUF427 domain-containing protein n=1 Tax=Aminobacter sp. UC22_36 TaxID=3374549 RepID=UPI003756550E